MILLIHPPVSKPSEPPPGLARIAGALKASGVEYRLLDANLEGLLFLLKKPDISPDALDTWSRRASSHLRTGLSDLRAPRGYTAPARYTRAVRDAGRILELNSGRGKARVGFADFRDPDRLPVKSADLIHAAETPEENPFFPYFQERLSQIIDGTNPALIGFSLNFLSQAVCAFAMIGWIRRTSPNRRIVLGGGLVTSWTKRPVWKDRFGGLVDEWVSGPGEERLLGMLDKNPPRYFLPDYESLPMPEYLSPGAVLPYSASSGCYWGKCAFCPELSEGNGYRPIPAEKAIAQIATLVSETRPSLIHFLDNALSPRFLARISENPPGAPWYGFARVSPELADPELCRNLKQSGCAMLKLGLESGDPGVLEQLEKGADLETATACLENLDGAGIAVYVYLLFGTPAEDEDAARRTLSFVERHAGRIGFLNLAIFNLPADSPGHEALRTADFYEGDLSLYREFSHPAGWNRPRVRRFLEAEFKKSRAVAPILRRDPPVFTSNHAPFFVLHGAFPEKWEGAAGK